MYNILQFNVQFDSITDLIIPFESWKVVVHILLTFNRLISIVKKELCWKYCTVWFKLLFQLIIAITIVFRLVYHVEIFAFFLVINVAAE